MIDLSNLRFKVQDPDLDVLQVYPALDTEFLSDIKDQAGNDILRYIVVRYDQEIWITQLPDENPEQASLEVCRTLGIDWEKIKEHCQGIRFAAAVNDYLILTQGDMWRQLVSLEANRSMVFLDSHNPKLKPSERKSTIQSLKELDDMIERSKGLMKSIFHEEDELVEEARNRMLRGIKGFVMSNIAEMERE